MGANQENSAALRTFRILETLAKSSRPLSLTEIVDQIDLPKQTIHRILTQMQESWLITRSPGSRNYTCSSRVNRFACNVMLNSGATAARNAILRDLVEQIGETCNITMLSGTEIVYVDRVETKWALRVHLQAGSRVPLHATASGKLLMSLLPKAQRERLLRTLPLATISRQSITNRAALGKELEQTRRRRIGINNQENLEGIIAVAVPIMLDRNRACAAVAVQAPISRMSLEQLLAHVPAMNEAAQRLKETFATDSKVPARNCV
ncbi:IclR family transcriptional regulator [Sulfuritalea sp.]|jgi:IclR family acetate operon transcriptional repressor|uniref:IclR family transcriptional regulator n=1 Tax=Sulfuritalea sp. TaxID=2480090 RepID=UPI001AD4436D|nr:IclR family transcriptional regulator [Sulfuritalea sp.]MBN8473314.1 IclR family transcriptional regulator [Sulfuritalea sp.]